MGLSVILFAVTVLVQASLGIPPHSVHHPPPPPPPPLNKPFPQKFSFGVASGAHNIEGAWDLDGKGESIWDSWLHCEPDVVIDGTNGDISADAYHHTEEDVEILNNLTVSHYKFSLSWTRIIPSGCGEVNKAGVRYYERLLKLLKDNQIEPIVTIYDGDLPQCLQAMGGFLSEDFTLWYEEYAKTVFELFGHYVKYWITFNNPTLICNGGYGDGIYAPGISDNTGVNDYLCGHILLKAHARVYHLYDDCYRDIQKGKISIALQSDWYEPNSDCQTDIDAAELKLQFTIGWFAHAIYIGDYPPAMIDRIGELSEYEGLPESRLPRFTRKEIEFIKDTHDFFALQWFTSKNVKAIRAESCGSVSYTNDIGVEILDIEGDITFGIKKLIIWIKDTYYNPSIFITASGFYTADRIFEDEDRITYIHDSLVNIRAAMINNDARVYGYTYYSYIDTFEWLMGYTKRYGLYDVEFDCPTRQRTARKSTAYYAFVCKFGCIDDPCPPKHHHSWYWED
ncbi:unnamed protein product [Psylliodes chrysocephalus]|uniref:Uncharacterized protein n=1 Tax=Psylliodes chrysocephalus TaxID=3402493 RepID=A0A9P0GAN1_9CUCU|nr:unnamed protein product [Psylliodes chrysocephala]